MALPTGRLRFPPTLSRRCALCSGLCTAAISCPRGTCTGQRRVTDPTQGGRTGNDAYVPPANPLPGPAAPAMAALPSRRRLQRRRQRPALRRTRAAAAPRTRARPATASPITRPANTMARAATARRRERLFAERDHRCRPSLLRLGEQGARQRRRVRLQKSGVPTVHPRPDAGGAFVAGLRYGEGTL